MVLVFLCKIARMNVKYLTHILIKERVTKLHVHVHLDVGEAPLYTFRILENYIFFLLVAFKIEEFFFKLSCL